MSRAFGNRMLKQFVVAEPEIQEQDINEELELLVLASDGLWDVVPNEDAISIAKAEGEADAAAGKLTETAFTRGSADNITCIVVKFHHDKAGRSHFESQKEPETQQDQREVPKPQQEQSKVPELPQDQSIVPEQRHDQMREVDLKPDQMKEVDLQHDQMKGVDCQQDQCKAAEAGLGSIKEVDVRQGQSKEAQPRHDLEAPSGHCSSGGSLASA